MNVLTLKTHNCSQSEHYPTKKYPDSILPIQSYVVRQKSCLSYKKAVDFNESYGKMAPNENAVSLHFIQ